MSELSHATPLLNFTIFIANRDTSGVVDMRGLIFAYCSTVGALCTFNGNISAWDVSSVTDMSQMFESASAFNRILCWDMSRVTNTSKMFTGSNTTYATAINNAECPSTTDSLTAWFLTPVYFELSAAMGVVGVVLAALFACLFRRRLGRWPPLLRASATAVSIASLGVEALYSAAAASSSGQFCTDCPSEAGWTIFLLSGILCGSILAYRLHQLRVALDTSVALGSTTIYAFVVLLACLEGDILVWLPWIETPATLALAGFPDKSSISFTIWSIFLRKLPFFVFTATNAADSGSPGATEYLTLVMTGTSIAMSLSTKFLQQIAFSNAGLNVFVGVRDDSSMTSSLITPSNQSSSSSNSGIATARLGECGGTGDASLLGNISGVTVGQNTGANGDGSGASSGYVGVTAPQVSSKSSLQTGASAAMGIGLIVLVVTHQIPSFTLVVDVGKYLFAGICAVLGLGIVAAGLYYAYATIVESYFGGKTVRFSTHEALKGDLETAEAKERDQREAAEVAHRRQEYMSNFVRSEFGVDPEQLLPLEEVTARLRIIMQRVEDGTASEEEGAEMNRLLSLLEANPEAKRQEEEVRAAFRSEQAPANAIAAQRLRYFFTSNARLLPSITALEAAGVGTNVARRLLRNSALALVLTPPEEIASMHWVDLRKCSSLGLSLFELRAVMASLPVKFATDTAKGEKQEWAKGLTEALRTMVKKEAKGELQRKDYCHPCFGTADDVNEDGLPNAGPFDPDVPLMRRPTAVRSDPTSGAAEAQAAATLSARGSVAERSATLVASGGVTPVDRASVVVADSAGARRLRGRRSSGTAMDKESRGNSLLAEVATAAAARKDLASSTLANWAHDSLDT
jgi:surface protein